MRLYAKIIIEGFNMLIKRDEYLNKLISKKWNGMIKVITGMKKYLKVLGDNMEKFHYESPSLNRKDEIISFLDEFVKYKSVINGSGGICRLYQFNLSVNYC